MMEQLSTLKERDMDCQSSNITDGDKITINIMTTDQSRNRCCYGMVYRAVRISIIIFSYYMILALPPEIKVTIKVTLGSDKINFFIVSYVYILEAAKITLLLRNIVVLYH